MTSIDVVQKLMSLSPEQTYKDFVLNHNKGIGGTETSAILGCNKWMDATELYYRKKGLYEDKDNITKKRGRILEPLVADLYAEDTGYQVFMMANRILCHPEQDISRGALDALAVTQDDQIVVVDMKSVVGRGAVQWYGDIPEHVKIQLQKYMWIVNGLVRFHCPEYTKPVFGDLGVLIDDQYMGSYNNTPDPVLWDIIKQADHDFWYNHFIPGIPPEPTTLEGVRMVYKEFRAKTRIEADENMIELLQQYSVINNKLEELLAKRNAWQGLLDDIKSSVIKYMGSNEYLVINQDGEEIVLATYAMQKNNIRSLRIKSNNLSLLNNDDINQ